jgi:hypothetical protein
MVNHILTRKIHSMHDKTYVTRVVNKIPDKHRMHVVAPQILIVLFLIYLFDNIIQLISLRSLWYYGGW